MRVLVVGGTKFIGRRIVAELVGRGDEVVVVHRGETEPADLAECRHLHAARADFASVAGEVRAFAPDAIVDTLAMSRAGVDAVLPHLPDAQLIVLSSMDVYQAFWHVLQDTEGEPLPLSETSRVRETRFPYGERRGEHEGYEKLDVEPSYVERGGTVLRLAMIYGEYDHQRREEFILRRVRAGRHRIPVGAANFLWTRCHVGDVAGAVLAAIGNPRAAGEVFNIGDPGVRSIRGWATEILAAAGHPAELVTVPEPSVPEDLWITKAVAQHLVFDGYKAANGLGWQPAPPAERLAESVAWHLAHPPADASSDFSADDAALALAVAVPPATAS
jgi:nucleoside-diphosphate-sugar epimerase